MAEGTIKGKEVLDGVKEEISATNDALKKLLATYNNLYQAAQNYKNTSKGNKISEATSNADKEVNLQLKERERLLKNLAIQEERNSQAQSAEINLEQKKERIKRSNVKLSEQEKYDQQQKNRLLKEDLGLQSKYTTELKKAQIIRNGLARTMQDLNVKRSLGTKLTKEENELLKKSTIEFKKYDSAIRGAEEKVGRFNASVGNYKKALGGLAGVAKGFIATFGVYSGIQIIRDIFEQVKQIEQLDLALKKVTKSQEEFNQTQLYIQEIAKFTGVGLISLTDSYKSFRGSIEGSNISLDQAQRIFERFTKASAILGSSTEETNGVLRALGQIISKGKVQAEELRGQLGDRLSGAFGLMAKSIGVSTAELDKMIEQGKITSDTLVKLAETVGDTFGVDTVDQIDTINASIGRLNTSWTILLKSFEDGSGPISSAFKGILKNLTNIIDKITEFNKGGDVKFDEGILQGAKVAIESVKDESDRLGISIKDAANNLIPRYNKILEEWRSKLGDINELQTDPNFFKRLVKYFNGSETEAKNALKQIGLYTKAIEVLKDISAHGLQNDKLNTDIAKPIDTLKVLRERLAELKASLENTEINTTAFSRIQTEISTLEQRIKSLTETTEKALSEIEKLTGKKIITFEIGTTQEQLKEALSQSKEILDSFTDTLGIKLGVDAINIDDFSEPLDAMAKKVTEVNKTIADSGEITQQKIRDGLAETLAFAQEIYGIDLQSFTDILSKKGEAFETTEEAIVGYSQASKETLISLSNAIFEETIANLEAKQYKNKQVLDAILNDENASDKKKEQAQRDYDRKEAAIKKKKAKADKQNAIINTIISTSVAILQAYAQLGPIGGTIAAVLIAALGALNVAKIKSQPVPEFFKGKKATDNFEGIGTWGERRREVSIDEKGNVEVSPNKKTPRFIKKSDIIIPSIPDFNREVRTPTSEVFKRLNGTLSNDTKQRTSMFAVSNQLDTKGFETVIKKELSELSKSVEKAMEKYSKRPTVWNGTVNIEQKRTRYHG